MRVTSFSFLQCAVSNMAAETVFLGGYKVGLISASLCPEGEKKRTKKKRESSIVFDESEATQPTFIPVKKKVKIYYYSALPCFRTVKFRLYCF